MRLGRMVGAVVGAGVLVGGTIGWVWIHAGNPDRAGEAGAYELTMIPWARLAAFNYLYSARATGAEALRINVGGLAHAEGTEFLLGIGRYYLNGALRLSALGFAQPFGQGGDNVLGVELFALSGGEIQVTTEQDPEGTGAIVEPVFINVALAYARRFSEFIYAGVVVRSIYEAIQDVSAAGVALDAGVQYTTEVADNQVLRFGVSLRNVGFPIRYRGPGLRRENKAPLGEHPLTQEIPAEVFELPLLLHIGFSYDYRLPKCFRLTGLFGFTSNTFGDDVIGVGVEGSWKEMVFARIGYGIEKGLIAPVGLQRDLGYRKVNLRTGLSLGLGFQWMLRKPRVSSEGSGAEESKQGTVLAIDYAFRPVGPLGNIHTLTVRLSLNQTMPGCIQAVESVTPRF